MCHLNTKKLLYSNELPLQSKHLRLSVQLCSFTLPLKAHGIHNHAICNITITKHTRYLKSDSVASHMDGHFHLFS